MKSKQTRTPVLVALAAALTALAAGCVSPGKIARAEATYPVDQLDARALFIENCAVCHGRDGRAKTLHGRVLGAQDFTDVFWKTETLHAEIVSAIRTGPRVMPAFRDKLSPAEIEALATFVQTFPADQP
jgi:mono/diheme cytochrome c family protein